MRTIKLVIIGDSGVGKTSLRSNYISGRFSTGYRATIGTDFITKILPHYSKPGEAVTLQIWDTAGQERFSGLSTAFFRGADAVLMMYDVNKPSTLQGLRKWWREFQERAPVRDEDAFDYCCVVVGNKVDLAEKLEYGWKMAIPEENVRTLLEELIPVPASLRRHESDVSRTEITPIDRIYEEPQPSNLQNGNGTMHLDNSEEELVLPKPIDIQFSARSGRRGSLSRATSRSRLNDTMTSTRTGLSVYHTPSSSLFEEFVSAPSSPMHSPSASRTRNTGMSPGSHHRRSTNTSTTSSATITPSSFARPALSTPSITISLDRGPKLFFTSAKSGHSVSSVFEYIAKRVVSRWEWEECVQDRTFDYTERSNEFHTIRLSQSKNAGWTMCCT